MITANVLRNIVYYNPEIGEFFWLVRPAHNSRSRAGDRIGSFHTEKSRRPSGNYRAHICHHNKKMTLGTFPTPEEAHAVYCKAALEFNKEFARYD